VSQVCSGFCPCLVPQVNALSVELSWSNASKEISGIYEKAGHDIFGFPYYKHSTQNFVLCHIKRADPAESGWQICSRTSSSERVASVKCAGAVPTVGCLEWQVLGKNRTYYAKVVTVTEMIETVVETTQTQQPVQQQHAQQQQRVQYQQSDMVAERSASAALAAGAGEAHAAGTHTEILEDALKQTLSLHDTLVAMRLDKYTDALRDLGCDEAEDLQDVDEDSLSAFRGPSFLARRASRRSQILCSQ
jgi:hypothetical protein